MDSTNRPDGNENKPSQDLKKQPKSTANKAKDLLNRSGDQIKKMGQSAKRFFGGQAKDAPEGTHSAPSFVQKNEASAEKGGADVEGQINFFHDESKNTPKDAEAKPKAPGKKPVAKPAAAPKAKKPQPAKQPGTKKTPVTGIKTAPQTPPQGAGEQPAEANQAKIPKQKKPAATKTSAAQQKQVKSAPTKSAPPAAVKTAAPTKRVVTPKAEGPAGGGKTSTAKSAPKKNSAPRQVKSPGPTAFRPLQINEDDAEKIAAAQARRKFENRPSVVATPTKNGKSEPKGAVTEETVVFSEDTGKQQNGKKEQDAKTQLLELSGKQKKALNEGKSKERGSIFKPRDKRPNFVLSVVLTSIKMSFVAIFLVVIIGVGSVLGVANAYLETTPELDLTKIEDQSLSSEILTPTGELLAIYTGSENRDWAAIDEIPEDLKNAVIAVEDIRFYEHDGVDLRRLIGAFVANLDSSTVQGGSTITQQLIKNQLLTSERSYKRKLQEAYLAIELEKKYDKEQILEYYLNTIPLGGTVYGVKTAASDYFGKKDLSQLTLKETICIAAITQNPHQYNPRRATYGQGNLVGLVNRMNIIAERMLWSGFITQAQYDEVHVPREEYAIDSIDADGEEKTTLKASYLQKWTNEMKILEKSPANEMYRYPHFIEYVVKDVQSFMLKQQGLEDTEENRQKMDLEMRSNGYQIYTTIDTNMQELVQNTFSEWDDYPKFDNSENNYTTKTDSKGNVVETIQPQAAAAVIDNKTGELKAIVGSRDEPTVMRTLNRADTPRAVGSSIKPIAVYAPAINIGNSPATSIPRVEVPITGWYLKNDEEGYPSGGGSDPPQYTIREGVVKSNNMIAARTLMEFVGTDTSYDYLQRLGISPSTNPDNIGGSGLAMGQYPISPIEMSAAYATLARGGEYLQPISFTRVVDSEGNAVIDATLEREQHEVFLPSTAWMMTDILKDAVDHGTGKNANIPGMTTAGKTGTVGEHRGTYFAGYTNYYSSAIWVGHDDNAPFAGDFASSVTAPLWKSYMTQIHEGLPDKDILEGDPEAEYGLVQVTICKWSNKLVGGSCGEGVTDWFYGPHAPTETCDVCYSGGGVYCSASHKQWMAGMCPEDTRYGGSGRNFPEGSPYAAAGMGGGGGGTDVPCDVHTTPIVTEPAEPVAPVDPVEPVVPVDPAVPPA